MAQSLAELLLELLSELDHEASAEEWEAALQETLESVADLDATERIQAVLEHEDGGRLLKRLMRRGGKEGEDSSFTIGMKCLALLKEDSDWHDATVEKILPEGSIVVRFDKFGHLQETLPDDVVSIDTVVDDDDEDAGVGACELCDREMPLTRHHLMPRAVHARMAKKGVARDIMERTCAICRACHNAVHHAESNMSLATSFNTLELLQTHPSVAKWVEHARRSRRGTSWDTAMLRSRVVQSKRA